MQAKSEKSRLTVSVAIPCFNAQEFLHETLTSVLNQKLLPDEVIVIDDGSTDASAEIAGQFGDPVRVVRQRNQGESVARNRAFDEATGDLIAFLDADDIWKPEKIMRQVECFQNDDRLVCVHSAYFNFGVSSDVCISRTPPELRYGITHVACHPFLIPSATMVRRSVAARFPTWTQYGEDLIFFLELLHEGTFHQIEDPLTGHRVHSNAQSSKSAIEIDWYRSVCTWLDQSRHHNDASMRKAIESGWSARLTRAATHALLRGRLNEYMKYRAYLQAQRMCRFPVMNYIHRLAARYGRRLSEELPARFGVQRRTVT
jgi:glycosyltransferase involved in cell wall biosynthesis